MSLLRELRRRRKSLTVVVIFALPTIFLALTDAVFVIWIFGPRMMSAVGPPPLSVAANPSQPVSAGTVVTIQVTNSTGFHITNADVSVTQSDGSKIVETMTDENGAMAFEYPGTPVAVSVQYEAYRRETIIVGVAPAIWYVGLGSMSLAAIILLGVIIRFWKSNIQLSDAYHNLESEYESLRDAIGDKKGLDELRKVATKAIDNVIHEHDIQNGEVARALVLFIENREIHEHLFYGLEFTRSEITTDRRLDRKLASFSLVQTFEELLLQLGIEHNAATRNVFETAKRPAISWMLKQLFGTDDEIMHAAIKELGGFDRDSGTLDFDNKLLYLLENRIPPSFWTHGTSLKQPILDFAITTLVRNFTHHQPTLDALLLNDDHLFQKTISHILSAMIRAFVLLRPSREP